MDLNFAPSLRLEDIQQESQANGDVSRPQPFRRHARLWLQSDCEAAVSEATARKAATAKLRYAHTEHPLGTAIEASYVDAGVRNDVEAVVIKTRGNGF